MGHRWLSTGNGAQCFRCGLVLDYMSEDENGGNFAESVPNASEIAHGIAPDCTGPETSRAHHLILAGMPGAPTGAWYLECAYGDAAMDEPHGGPDPSSFSAECIGA